MYTQLNLVGRLVEEPTARKSKNGKEFANIRLVTDYYDNVKKDFVPMYHQAITFNENIIAKIQSGKLSKGSLVYASGSLSPLSYDKKDGSKVESYEITINTLMLLAEPKTKEPVENSK